MGIDLVGETIRNSCRGIQGVSVVVPAKNEEKHIGLCLESLLCQEFDGLFEIIVVDNQSEDETALIAKSKGVTVIGTSAATPAAVRNFGASISQYDLLAFIDGDCEAPWGWLRRAVSAFCADSVLGAYGGPYSAPSGANWIVLAWAPVSQAKGRYKVAALPGGNFFVRKPIFLKLNGFDESLVSAEDDDLARRVQGLGYDIVCDADNAVMHFGYPDSMLQLFKKAIWHGSSQLKAHGFFQDKLVALTWIWLFSIILTIVAAFLLSSNLQTICLLIVAVGPALLTIARQRMLPWYGRLRLFIPSYCVSAVVLAGRSVGMIREVVSVPLVMLQKLLK